MSDVLDARCRKSRIDIQDENQQQTGKNSCALCTQNGVIHWNSLKRKPGLLASETMPLPSNTTSMLAMAVDRTTLVGVISRTRTMPRIRSTSRSRLIVTSLTPSIPRSPFGKTCTTRAETKACNCPVRDVEPCPAKFNAEEPARMSAKLGASLFKPATEGALIETSPSFFVAVFAEFEAVELSLI